jgi:hypothetical protein
VDIGPRLAELPRGRDIVESIAARLLLVGRVGVGGSTLRLDRVRASESSSASATCEAVTCGYTGETARGTSGRANGAGQIPGLALSIRLSWGLGIGVDEDEAEATLDELEMTFLAEVPVFQLGADHALWS